MRLDRDRTTVLLIVGSFLAIALLTSIPATADEAQSGTVENLVYVLTHRFQDRETGTTTTLVPVGATVTWAFLSGSHTVTHGTGPQSAALVTPGFDSEVTAGNSADPPYFQVTFDAPGVYPYFCRVQPDMTGTVIVPDPLEPRSPL